MKERQQAFTSVFLLFPTITHIVRTPNGRRLSVCCQLLSSQVIDAFDNPLVVISIAYTQSSIKSLQTSTATAQGCCCLSIQRLASRTIRRSLVIPEIPCVNSQQSVNGSRRDADNQRARHNSSRRCQAQTLLLPRRTG